MDSGSAAWALATEHELIRPYGNCGAEFFTLLVLAVCLGLDGALHRMGTMNRGAPQLVMTVVPDFGTGDLVGLAGPLDIKIVDGKHFYTFDYVLPEKE